jgi:Zn-dependent peptidase ImmA (M78 family)
MKPLRVSTLTLQQLEQRASQLLAEYALTLGGEVPVPIPVKDIAENELGLRVQCMNIRALLESSDEEDDILGLMDFEKNRILIDQSLDPDVLPHRLGRYRFSIAHEIGHWRLHKKKVLENQARTNQPPIICRDSGREKMPMVEWQAENFASFLLIPRDRLLDAWGTEPPFVFNVQESGSRELRAMWMSSKADPNATRRAFARECEKRFEQFADRLAWAFEVSKQAMAIRLEGIGLLRRSPIGLKVCGPSRSDFLHSPKQPRE